MHSPTKHMHILLNKTIYISRHFLVAITPNNLAVYTPIFQEQFSIDSVIFIQVQYMHAYPTNGDAQKPDWYQ
jgi:hypothetical protein